MLNLPRTIEPITAIKEDKVRRGDAHPIHLCQQVFSMPIRVEFLNFAQPEVGDNEGAIIGHRQPIWFIAAQTTEKLLGTIGIDAGHATTAV